jgi:predicted acetyltransferase
MPSPIDVDVRRITPDELVPWIEAMATTFLSRPDVGRIAELNGPHYDFARTWGAFDGRVVGTLRSWATELTVPGGALLPAAAVVGITVLPSHRRRGILRRMIAAEHEAARERGETVAILHASEASIYGRFGYGTGVTECDLTLDTCSTGFVGAAAAGGVSLAPLDETTVELVRGLYDRYRRTRAGEIRRRDHSFVTGLGLAENGWEAPWKGWVAVHRDAAGDADGYVSYGAELKWERGQPRSIVAVRDLVALGDAAYDALWRYMAELDLVATVKADRRSPYERLPWILTNSRAVVIDEVGDGLWVCLLDVPAALAARTYDRPGDLVFEVVDPEPGTGRTRVRLEVGPDGAACATTTRDPDLTVHADALGAAYLGGTPLGHAVLARGFEEHRPGALAEADALFRTLDQPRCMTFF